MTDPSSDKWFSPWQLPNSSVVAAKSRAASSDATPLAAALATWVEAGDGPGANPPGAPAPAGRSTIISATSSEEVTLYIPDSLLLRRGTTAEMPVPPEFSASQEGAAAQVPVSADVTVPIPPPTRIRSRDATLELEVDEILELDDTEFAHRTPASVEPEEVVVDEEEEVEEVAEHEVEEAVDDVIEPPEPSLILPPAAQTSTPDAKSADRAPLPPPPPAGVSARKPKAWYDDFFATGGAALSSHAQRRDAARDVAFVLDVLHASEPRGDFHSLLDLACGDGRHSFEFANSGLDVCGVDLCSSQVRRAGEKNSARARPLRFVEADMREVRLGEVFDVVTCIGSSLGYADVDADLATLATMRAHLDVGGRAVLQTFNRDYVVSNIPCRSWWSSDGALVLDEVDFDFMQASLRVHRTMLADDGMQHEHFIAIRAYTLNELLDMVRKSGFQILEVAGSRITRGHFLGASAPDIWIFAEAR